MLFLQKLILGCRGNSGALVVAPVGKQPELGNGRAMTPVRIQVRAMAQVCIQAHVMTPVCIHHRALDRI